MTTTIFNNYYPQPLQFFLWKCLFFGTPCMKIIKHTKIHRIWLNPNCITFFYSFLLWYSCWSHAYIVFNSHIFTECLVQLLVLGRFYCQCACCIDSFNCFKYWLWISVVYFCSRVKSIGDHHWRRKWVQVKHLEGFESPGNPRWWPWSCYLHFWFQVSWTWLYTGVPSASAVYCRCPLCLAVRRCLHDDPHPPDLHFLHSAHGPPTCR